MANPLRRPLMYPPRFFEQPEQDGYLGFEDVAGVPGVGDDQTGVGADGLPQLDAQQLIEPAGGEQVPGDENSDVSPPDSVPEFDPSLSSGTDAMHKRAAAMIAAGQDDSPIQSPWQAAGRAVQQITGAYLERKATEREQQAAAQHQKALMDVFSGQSSGNPTVDRMLASPDPAIVNQGLNILMAQAKSTKSSTAAPTVKDFVEGGETVQKQWDPDTKSWKEVGRGARFARQLPGISINTGGGGKGGSGAGGDYDSDTLDFMAEQYMAGDRSVFQNMGRGAQGQKNVMALRTRVAKMAREIDPATGKPRMTPRQMAAAQAELQGYGAYMRTSEQSSARMRGKAAEARNMAPDVITTSKRVPRTAIRGLNFINNEFRAQTGDPNIVAFAAALNSYVNAYVGAIKQQGAPTLEDYNHARDILTKNMSQGQIEAGIAQLDREMQNSIAAPGDVREEREQEWDSGNTDRPRHTEPLDQSDSSAAPAAKPTYKAGEHRVINGKKFVRDANGRWLPE